jgi:beta-1,2-mannobiose phosphorylase / 1,2-beta-oligomannan phosphorylase
MYIVKRNPKNPIIAPAGEHTWESQGAFNGCPVKKGDSTYILYRALGAPDPLFAPSGLSTVNIAVARGAGDFEKMGRFIVPDQPWDKAGCEDPRVTFFEGRYIVFYTALGGYPFSANNIRVGVAISRDLKTVEEKHLLTPFNAKAMALFPERVHGKVTAIISVHTDEPPAKMAIVECNEVEDLWDPKFWEHWHEKLPEHVLSPLRRENDHVEVGAPPVRTKDGWLLLYSYIQNYFGGGDRVFGIEGVLLGETDPRTIIGRTKGPIIVPEELYERYGTTPNIVFPSGALLSENGRLEIYYGAADSVCASASVFLPDLLDAMHHGRRAKFTVRSVNNPIISPTEHAWEKKATFNAGAIDINGEAHLLYRAMGDDNTSVLGYATMTKDGLSVKERFPVPAYVPRADFELKRGDPRGNSGCEDPRITRIGDALYMSYTAYDGVHTPRSALTSISIRDFLARDWGKWEQPNLVTPDTVDDKDMCILPEKCRGNYYIFHRIGAQICADFRESLDFSEERLRRCIDVMGPRPGMWDSKKIGIAGVPILTNKGWLFIYHGISSSTTYRLGAALLDLDDPTRVIARMVDPILEPAEQYEREGQVPRVVFSCGGIVRDDTLIIYYGGADSVTCATSFSIQRLLSILAP